MYILQCDFLYNTYIVYIYPPLRNRLIVRLWALSPLLLGSGNGARQNLPSPGTPKKPVRRACLLRGRCSPSPSQGGGGSWKAPLGHSWEWSGFCEGSLTSKNCVWASKGKKNKGFWKSFWSYFEGRSKKCESMFYLHGSSLFQGPEGTKIAIFWNEFQERSKMHPWEALFTISTIFRCSMGPHFAQDGSHISGTLAPPDAKLNT